MKTGAGPSGLYVVRSCSRQGLIAGGEERVQVERPQPRSGEDDRPGRETSRRQDGRAVAEEVSFTRCTAAVVPASGGREPGSSLYRLLGGRTRSDRRGFAPVAQFNAGASTRPEVLRRLPERRACSW